MRLGFATSTDDLTGEPLSEPRARAGCSRADVERALAGFVGSFDQLPPAFSAKHVGGRRLYELARRGEVAPRSASPVTVHAIELVDFADDRLEILVRCSPGTYVRALARDLGEKLGVGGHLTALRRTRSGPFDLSVGRAGRRSRSPPQRRLVPMAALLPEMPAVAVAASARPLLKNGRDLAADAVTQRLPVRSRRARAARRRAWRAAGAGGPARLRQAGRAAVRAGAAPGRRASRLERLVARHAIAATMRPLAIQVQPVEVRAFLLVHGLEEPGRVEAHAVGSVEGEEARIE